MGQYYKVVNIDKKEYMYSDGGIKLMEWSYNRNPLVLNIMKKLANEIGAHQEEFSIIISGVCKNCN